MTQTASEIASILIWGFAATAALSAVMFAAQRMGYSRLSIPFLIGTNRLHPRSCNVRRERHRPFSPHWCVARNTMHPRPI